ncbi:MAG: bifunctional folylpolyglutamate synthase/dihydrofolate synthase [Lachnospiraceae bacterium]|nr:bifunctional folylpolyglutamate synthase/dihydrofolate synthase [Lachnospiraceae bacterium]
MISDYESCVKHLYNIPFFLKDENKRSKSGNENLSVLMNELGNSHKNVKCIHIAGTNGKGSVANFIKCILKKSGYTVGVFTSPHLVDIRERIMLDGLISKEDFLDCFNKVSEAETKIVKEGYSHISYFEFMFAMAAVYFAKEKPDYVIYETGLGGRLDATNLLLPEITVITSIGFDHMKYLGDSIELIAGEKAGIIKEKIPIVYNTGDAAADTVISKAAKSHNSKEINVAKTNYIIHNISDKTIDFSLFNSYYRYDNLEIMTSATYQVDNAITAIETCNELLGRERVIDECVIKKALLDFNWPCRMEHIYPNVIIDGAHNEDAIERFIETVKKVYKDKKTEILFAVCEDKDYEPMIKMLCQSICLSRVYVTAINSVRAASPESVADIFKSCLDKNDSTDIIVDNDIKTVFNNAVSNVIDKEDTVLFVVGSLYLAGSIKQIVLEANDD